MRIGSIESAGVGQIEEVYVIQRAEIESLAENRHERSRERETGNITYIQTMNVQNYYAAPPISSGPVDERDSYPMETLNEWKRTEEPPAEFTQFAQEFRKVAADLREVVDSIVRDLHS